MPAKPSISARADQLIENEKPRLIRKEVIICPLLKGVTVYASGTNRVADVQRLKDLAQYGVWKVKPLSAGHCACERI